jgi:hypothetical protein
MHKVLKRHWVPKEKEWSTRSTLVGSARVPEPSATAWLIRPRLSPIPGTNPFIILDRCTTWWQNNLWGAFPIGNLAIYLAPDASIEAVLNHSAEHNESRAKTARLGTTKRRNAQHRAWRSIPKRNRAKSSKSEHNYAWSPKVPSKTLEHN